MANPPALAISTQTATKPIQTFFAMPASCRFKTYATSIPKAEQFGQTSLRAQQSLASKGIHPPQQERDEKLFEAKISFAI